MTILESLGILNDKLENLITRLSIGNIKEDADFLKNIDRIFYINIADRIDRKHLCINQLRLLNPTLSKIERFEGMIYNDEYVNNSIRNKGSIGCGLSHVEIIKICKDRNYQNVLIVEDDILLNTSLTILNRDMNYFFENIKDFSFLLLGTGQNLKCGHYKDFLYKVNMSDCLTAYVVNHSIFDDWINEGTQCINRLIKTGVRQGNVIDNAWYKYQRNGQSYTFNTENNKHFIQRMDYSNIDQCIVDPK